MLITLTGHQGCGKSYAAKLLRSDLAIVNNINAYDFITRLLLYVINIHPSKGNYKTFTNNYLDYALISHTSIQHFLNYTRDTITINQGVNQEAIQYFMSNIFGCSNTITLDDSFYTKANLLYKNGFDLALIYSVTTTLYNDVVKKQYDFSNRYDVAQFLDLAFKPYIEIIASNNMIYYAYSLNEILYLKERFNSPVIWLDMAHEIRTNTLAASNSIDKLELNDSDEYKKEMADMKLQASAIVNNDFDFDVTISNKIKYHIAFG